MVLPSPLATNSHYFFSRGTFFLRMVGLPVFESQALPLLVHPAQVFVFLDPQLESPIFPCCLKEFVIVRLGFWESKLFPDRLTEPGRPVPAIAVEQSEVVVHLSSIVVQGA